MASSVTSAPKRDVDPNRLLYSLMVPGIVMPLAGWMFTVSLPIIRDDFGISAEVAAWIATSFSLPFVILMPVYGRVSDGLGKRRLLLFGVTLFALGNVVALTSTTLSGLIFGRILQGVGASGLMPLILAMITEVFPQNERGNAMGRFSTVGPVTGVIGPVLAGFIVANYGWRVSFIPAIVFSILALAVIYFFIPSRIRTVDFSFLRTFDWTGVGLLALTLSLLLFYFSSKPITGVAAFRDWRLLIATVVALSLFIAYEKRKTAPFVNLNIFKYRELIVASLGAMLRMIALSGCLGFLMPLYLADIVGLDPTTSGFFLLVNPAAMVIVVRLAGQLSDRWGSRNIVMLGFAVLTGFMLAFSQLPADVPYAILIALLAIFGLGAGIMLASLHRAALNNIPEVDLGTSSGVYSMIRFLGSACGAAFGGVLLQLNLDRPEVDLLSAYQFVFLCYAGFALLGLLTATQLPKASQA